MSANSICKVAALAASVMIAAWGAEARAQGFQRIIPGSDFSSLTRVDQGNRGAAAVDTVRRHTQLNWLENPSPLNQGNGTSSTANSEAVAEYFFEFAPAPW